MALTGPQLQALREDIERRLQRLQAEIREDVERTRSREEDRDVMSGASPDAGDESVASLLADLGHAELGRDVGELRALQAALARMDAGPYGTCAECGADIGLERLRANPAAERCIDCQRRHEATHAGQPRASL